MVTSPSKGARVAAGIVCAVFAVFVAFHLLWAVGVTWGLEELFPGGRNDASIELTIASLVGAAAGAAVIFVTISRVGWHKTRLPDPLVHLGAWVAFAWPAIGTLNPDTTSTASRRAHGVRLQHGSAAGATRQFGRVGPS